MKVAEDLGDIKRTLDNNKSNAGLSQDSVYSVHMADAGTDSFEREKGFHFMDSPGYDPVSVTGQVAAGSNLICFTTGRGSCFGFKPTPSLKIATNTNMYNNLEEDMDINAGTIMDGISSIEEIGTNIFNELIEVASGKKTKSEINEYGDDEFNPWVIGATM